MRSLKSIITLALSAVGVAAGCQSQSKLPVAEDPSVTVYPIIMAGEPSPDVAEVVAVLLERGGLEGIAIAPLAFAPDERATFEERTQAFADFVRAHPMPTSHALYGAFAGSPERGVDEIQAVLADTDGNVVWSDRQARGDAAFERARPDCPMDCTVFLVDRLKRPLGLDDPMRADAPEGRMAERMRVRSLVPTDTELDLMEARVERLHEVAPETTVLVYPVRIGDKWCAESARRLAESINGRGLMKATPVTEPMPFTIEPDRDQQKVLWSGARSIQNLVREQHPDVDYVLLADYMIGRREAHAVHTYLLEPDGDWVIVDYQNSHHRDFQRIRPVSAGDCSDLATIRLAGYLQ